MTVPSVVRGQAPAVPAATMRSADQEAAARFRVEPIQLMEVAGFQIARLLSSLLEGVNGRRIAVVAGSGNNGGDALVAARHLHNRGALVRVGILSAPGGLAAAHLETVRALQIPVEAAAASFAGRTEWIVDGLFGTGVRLPLRPEAAALIASTNASGIPILAVDLPSGLDADTGAGSETCVRATATVTLGLPKPALLDAPSTGRLFVADIGLPSELFAGREDAIRTLFAADTLVELV
ncbi:MAG TPA: NAD(P)H-hydrate epimerase [Candidatus Limnocylindrales bacterium]|nr:NAD(P)H-hydrate epimerase [Candidatus Limnocylindrales bacterium]